MKLTKLLILCAGFMLMQSCNYDDASTPLGGFTFNKQLGASTTRNFSGLIVDTDHNPVAGATVTIGSSTAQTDENGVFFIDGATVYTKFAYVSVTKTGYVDGSRALVPTSGRNHVQIMMLPLTEIGTVQTGEESQIDLPNGTKITFDGSFENEDGQAYSGTVSVAAFHLMPSDPNLNLIMPGMLFGQTESEDARLLETYGMLNVELRGSDGQKLQIADGHTAGIEMTIDNSQTATAPQTIPLWHFDQQKGYWIEQGSATKNGNKYIGEVSHFSWWNCDAPFQAVVLQAVFHDADGNPVSNMTVALYRDNVTWPAYGYTDENGQVSGLVPLNESLTLKVLGAEGCSGVPLYTATVGPFTTNTILPTITLPSTGIDLTTVSGTILNCDGEPVTNGYALIKQGGHTTIAAVSNGNFSVASTFCSGNTEFTVIGYDADEFQQTDVQTVNFTTPITDIGTLSTCNQLDEFIIYSIDGAPSQTLLNNVEAFVDAGYLTVKSGAETFLIFGQAPTTGVYSMDFSGIALSQNFQTTSDMMVTITEYGGVGEAVSGTFTGTYDDAGVEHTLTGSFKAIREF